MDVRELVDTLNRKLRAGVITEDTPVKLRNASISEGAMEAGSDGWHELEEVLIGEDSVNLFTEPEDY